MAEVTGHEERLLLLAALKLRRRDHPIRWNVGTAVLGVLNLFFCAYMERFIDTTAGSEALLSLLAVESALLLAAAAAVFLGEMDTLLHRTALFPYGGRVRFHFALGGLARHPALLVLWGTAVFAVAVIGPVGWIPVIARSLFCLLLGAMLLICFCTLLVLPAFSRSRGSPVVAVTAILIAGMGFWSATSSAAHLLSAVLPLQWTADGIAAAQRGEFGRSLVFVLFLVVPSAACIFWGSRDA